MLLRLYVNTNEYVGSLLVHSVAIRDAYTYALRLLEYPGREATILTCSDPLKIHALAIFRFPSLFDGVKESI